jgi:multidrug efflux system membrane fusion protein
MTGPTLRRLLWLQALLIVTLLATLVWWSWDNWRSAAGQGPNDDHDKTRASAAVVAGTGGPAIVRVSPEARQASGIAVAPAQSYLMPSRREAYGVVVDARPLLELRARYLAARSEQAAAGAIAARADAERRRTAALYADDRNASQKALEAAEADAQTAQAKAAAAAAAVAGLDAQLRQGWGDQLAAWARVADSADLARLAERRATLVQIVEPSDAPATVSVRIPGATATIPARLLSAAPLADPALAGGAWFYRASGPLPAGARILAELPAKGSPRQGVRVPASALVWHAGSPWIYLAQDDEGFVRHAAAGAEPVGEDWFVPGIPAQAQVVVEGAQILLSEELRYQIKNENED